MEEFETCDLGEGVVLILSRRHRRKCPIIKRHLVISNISACNVTLCHRHHFACELRFIGPAVKHSSDRYCLLCVLFCNGTLLLLTVPAPDIKENSAKR